MILEVFSCSGGFAEGLRRAGLPVDMAFNHDADACDSYEANLGHRPIQMDAHPGAERDDPGTCFEGKS